MGDRPRFNIRRWKRRMKRGWRFIVAPASPVPNSPWARAADWALVIAFLLAVSVQWILARESCTTSIILQDESSIQLVSNSGDEMSLALGLHESGSPANGTTVGYVTWKLRIERCGWPFTLARHPLPVIADWTLDEPLETRSGSVIPMDHPLQPAIMADLANRFSSTTRDVAWASRALVEDWEAPAGNGMLVWNTTFGVVLSWMVIYLAIRIPMGITRVGFILYRRSAGMVEEHRARTGRCPQCGYDLEGLDHAANCPECGSLLW